MNIIFDFVGVLVNDDYEIKKETKEVIPILSQNHTLAIASSASSLIIFQILKNENLLDYFKFIAGKDTFESRKPSSIFFQQLLSKLPKDKTIFIDDKEINCEAAKKLSIKCYLYGRDIFSLYELGDLV